MGNGTATATAGREGDLGHPRRRPMARTCASSLARVVQQDGVWPGLTEEGARMARCMAIEDGEVPTSDSPCRCTRDSAWPTPSLRAGMTRSTRT